MENTTNTKNAQSLENILTSYNLLILFFSLFIFLMLVMLNTNLDGFNKAFGYQIFITAPILLIYTILIREIANFNANPQESLFTNLPQSKETWFIPAIIATTISIGIIGFFMMLYIGGIFADNPPENNSAMILNFILILLFIVVAGTIYSKNKEKDENIISKFPKAVQNSFAFRNKYTAILFVFILLVSILYFVNPWGIMTDYGGPVVFFTLFVGMVCAVLIIVYQKFLSDTAESGRITEIPTFLGLIIKGLYILVALFISGSLIYAALNMIGVFEQDASKPESWGHIFFNLLMFCAMLGILYKLANAGGFLDKNPLYRLILNTLLYIPCLLVSITNYIVQIIGYISGKKETGSPFKPPNIFEMKMLLLGLVLLGLYFFWFFFLKSLIVRNYLKQGGKQLINQPIPIDVLTNVASYQTLADSDTFDYRYALSFWVYLDSFPPSTNSSYLKVVPILSYGENPCVKYSSERNTLFITVKQADEEDIKRKEENVEGFTVETVTKWKDNITNAIEKVKTMSLGNEYDTNGDRIIYSHPNVLLQKWNHIVLNYNGGTLDVFYNGKLVKSAIQVSPYIKYDNLTVGSDNGIKGDVANLMYFKMPLDILTINTLYTSLKDKNPPCISDNQEKLIPLSS